MINTMKKILQWSEYYKKNMILGFIYSFAASIAAALPVMLAAYMTNLVVSSYWSGKELPSNIGLVSAGAIAVFILLRYFFSYKRAVLQDSIGYEAAAYQRKKLGDVLKRVSLGYFSDKSTGEILAAMTTELSALEQQSMKIVDSIINGYINLAAVFLCLLIFSWSTALLVLAGAIISLIPLNALYNYSKNSAKDVHKTVGELSGAIIEYIRGLSIVKAFGEAGISIKRLRESCDCNKKANITLEKGFVFWSCMYLLVLKIVSVVILGVCSIQTLLGTMDFSIFLMFALFSFTIFGAVEKINESLHVLNVIESAMQNLSELGEVDYIDDMGNDIALKNFTIRFDHVSFGYGNRTVLHDINCLIKNQTTTAIVGPSGSGKTTFCNLIARFYDVNEGSIMIGRKDVREFTCDSLLKNISVVFQKVYLFNDTIMNNIRFGNPAASDEEIINAAKTAKCHEFIMDFPDGYDTVVGEGGSTLSGGEKQRISIARAILKNAPIVILDEATASIDPENEHFIQEALSSLTMGKTVLTIAHRLATIQNADQIIVIDNGILVQCGTHEELLKQEGVYRNFAQIRSRVENWRMEI